MNRERSPFSYETAHNKFLGIMEFIELHKYLDQDVEPISRKVNEHLVGCLF